MAQQHYDGKKHKKNAARVALLEQLGTTLDMGELRGKGALPISGTELGFKRKECVFTYWHDSSCCLITKGKLRFIQGIEEKGISRKPAQFGETPSFPSVCYFHIFIEYFSGQSHPCREARFFSFHLSLNTFAYKCFCR